MSFKEKAEKTREELIRLFGEDDAIVSVIDNRFVWYNQAEVFKQFEKSGLKYEEAIRETAKECNACERTIKRSVSKAKIWDS